MSEVFEFDGVQTLTAGARGVPGKRTFFILAGQGERLVRVWVEKEQLQALGEAIAQLIEKLPERRRPRSNAEEAPEASDRDEGLAGDFRGHSLALGYDRDEDRAALLVNDATDDASDTPALQVWATLDQMQALSRRIVRVCAAGRPPCPLCGLPLDPDGHVCPRRNGHHPALRLS